MLVIMASPHAHGVTDRLALACIDGAKSRGAQVSEIIIRDYRIAPCNGCGACAGSGKCRIHDDAPRLLAMIAQSALAVIASPIYFYALPAPFKALIDRCQSCWQAGARPNAGKTAVILAAGRKQGAKLFSGSLLTLKYFLLPLGHALDWRLNFTGLDNEEDLAANPQCLAEAYRLGMLLGSQCP